MTQTAVRPVSEGFEEAISGISVSELAAMEEAATRFLSMHAVGGDHGMVTAPMAGLTADAPAGAAGLVSNQRDIYHFADAHRHFMAMVYLP